MLDISQETKKWIRDQGVAIVILCVVLYGAYELFERQRESHERQIAAITLTLDKLANSYASLDKRVEVMAVDLEFINGRSKRTLKTVRELESVTAN